MVDYSCKSADHVKYKNDVKYKNLYPVFMKELQNAWNWSAAMNLRRTDIKQQNKNVNGLTFVFEHVNNTRWKQEVLTNVFKWYNLQRNSSSKKSQRTAMFIGHFLSC